MEVNITKSAFRKFIKLIRKDPKLPKLIDKKIALFIKDQTHTSLRLHKVNVKGDDLWSISIKSDLRILFFFRKSGVVITDIGSHEEVY